MKKKIFISGASKGIGKAIVKELDSDTYEIIACARTLLDLENLRSEINAAKFTPLALDLTSDIDIEKLKTFFNTNGYPEIVIANFNVSKPYKKIENYSSHTNFFESVTEHLNYLIAITAPTLAHQRSVGFGRWIGISSAITKLKGIQGQGYYLTQKRMLESYIDTLVVEANHSNITANCVLPGLVETERIKENPLFNTLSTFNLLKRAAKPEEVASMVAFLISDKAGYITGEKFSIDGGAQKTWMLNTFLGKKK